LGLSLSFSLVLRTIQTKINTQTPPPIQRCLTVCNEGLPQPEHTEVEVPSQLLYSNLLKSGEVVTAYLKHEECKKARACGKAIGQVLPKFSAAHSQSNLNYYSSSKP
jgi:hypothetical protein